MRWRQSGGDNLVLGMSLAEVLLLFLFTLLVAQAAGTAKEGPAVVAALRQQIEKLVRDSTNLSQRVRDLESEIAEKTAIIDALSRMAGAPINDVKDVPGIVSRLKRGFPVCRDSNTIVEAIMENQHLRLALLIDEPALQSHIPTQGVQMRKGDTLSTESAIDAFLNAVRLYGNRRGAECRFDYRLRYGNAQDYYLAREKLEHYLYPEQRVHIGS